MSKRKNLIGAVSILGLSGAPVQMAGAALTIEHVAKIESGQTVVSSIVTDPLLDLIAQTNGSLSPDVMKTAITRMYADLRRYPLESIPKLITDLTSFGLASDDLEEIKIAFCDIIAKADEVDEGVRLNVASQIDAERKPIQMAETNFQRPPRGLPFEDRDPVSGASNGGAY